MSRSPSTRTPGVTRDFVGLDSTTARQAGSGGHPCQGLYHRGVGRRPKVAMIATHYQIDFSEHYLADYMATRGIGFLGWNTRYRGFESSFLLDHALVDIGVGVRWLREVQGIETVILLGNSGGGSLMAAYQANAVDRHVTPMEGMRPAVGLDDLPPADGYVASAAHPGRPEVLTAWMDAAVIDESDAIATDPDLDLFNERNGPPYDADFVQRYRAAQVARNDAITDWAQAGIDCPARVISAEQDTGVYPSDAQRIYDALGSTDKTQCAIDTDHYFTTPGARTEKADTIAKWIARHW